MADFSLRRSRKLLSHADLPLLIQSGPIHPEWATTAETKGFTCVCRVRDRQHVALRCHTCGRLNAVRTNVLLGHNPHCHHCLDTARHQTADAAGLTFLRRDPDNHKYAFYEMPCGHEIRRQFGFVQKVSRGEVSARCETCLIHREEAEALRFDWTRLSRDPEGNANYRLYRHMCGRAQHIARANMQWGQCDCAGCGESWTAKPSFIYLLDIRHAASHRHYLKLGYSAHPAKRHRHQLGLPKDAMVEVLRVVLMPTGHDACAIEKAAHVRLGNEHPEAVVPPPDYADLMNVVSEIYSPESLAILHRTLDRIEADHASGRRNHVKVLEPEANKPAASRRPGSAPFGIQKDRAASATRRRRASGRHRTTPILRRHWGLSG